MFNEVLKSLRNKRGLTQESLANKLNVSPSTYGLWEQGRRTPEKNMLIKIADLFDVSVDDLLGRKKLPPDFFPASEIDYNRIGVKVPILGTVKAGIPILAIENIIGYGVADLDDNTDYFLLKVKGDSMQPDIKENSHILVHKQNICSNGQIVVVLINGDEATVKTIKFEKNGVILIPSNPAYDTIFISKEQMEREPEYFRIIGVVKEVRTVLEK
jgi:repressor LexA